MVSAIEELKDQGHGDQSHCRDAGVTGPEARPRWVVAGLGRHLECLDQVQGLTSGQGAGVGPGILPCQKKAWKRSLCCLLDALDRLLRKAALRVVGYQSLKIMSGEASFHTGEGHSPSPLFAIGSTSFAQTYGGIDQRSMGGHFRGVHVGSRLMVALVRIATAELPGQT